MFQFKGLFRIFIPTFLIENNLADSDFRFLTFDFDLNRPIFDSNLCFRLAERYQSQFEEVEAERARLKSELEEEIDYLIAQRDKKAVSPPKFSFVQKFKNPHFFF